jgi:luciferase family oxidoreductase group 1
MVAYSVLDLVPVVEGGTVAQALGEAVELARHTEALGYKRYWVAEHHGMPGIGSAATSIVIAQAGFATSTIRVGAGGIMLPNHSPLVIAEQFGTLDALFPGREARVRVTVTHRIGRATVCQTAQPRQPNAHAKLLKSGAPASAWPLQGVPS